MDNKVIVGIHQPNFLPWLGYFYKIDRSDVFVLLDNVQYTKNSFINRNRIKTPQGAIWLTVPVSFRFGQLINEVKINNKTNWREKHLKTLEMNYKRAVFFEDVFKIIKEIYYLKDWQNLSDFNIRLISAMLSYIGLDKALIKSSSLDVKGKSTELHIQIIKKVGGNIYLSGFGGKKYQEEKLFKKERIELVYYNFSHPTYKQLWGDFIPNLSIIDLLFNMGPESAEIIRNSGGFEK
ncbi:MAG TPA: hypothetical protein ENI51_02415 [Candidatus Atribacteria bacterium]|nr:hypothetical protein [Candidatus Atribacteria bacterium]